MTNTATISNLNFWRHARFFISATRLNNTAIGNKAILTEIAKDKSLFIDTDQISALFVQGTTWKTSQLGLVILALEGVIPIEDRRLPDIGHDTDLEQSSDEIQINKNIRVNSDTQEKEPTTEKK